jgi:two-component system, LytTR family, response regulator
LIDDEWLVRLELSSMLCRYPGVEVVAEASSVDEALPLIKQTDPDLLFLDIQMPGKNGFELLDLLPKKIPVIFISAYDEYINESKRYSPVGFLLKPIGRDKLDRLLRKLGIVAKASSLT